MVTSTSNRWRAREIKKLLDDASELQRGVLQPSDITLWMLDSEFFLEDSFGRNHRYYRLFPKIRRTFLNENPIVRFNEAIDLLQDILQDIQ